MITKKRRIGLVLVLVFSLVMVGCGSDNQPELTQVIKHPMYTLHVPDDWKVVYSEVGDPTLRFEQKDGTAIGGLVLLRVENLTTDIGTDPEEVVALRTERTRLYFGDNKVNGKDEHYYCVYVPEQNSGYYLYFNPDVVSGIIARTIAESLKVNFK